MSETVQITQRELDRMLDKIGKANRRIAELEAENKALWAFVDAEDAFNAMMDSGDWEGDDDAYNLMLAAREALRPYEKKPFTYDPDAPLKLA